MTAVGIWVAFGARWKPVEVGSDMNWRWAVYRTPDVITALTRSPKTVSAPLTQHQKY